MKKACHFAVAGLLLESSRGSGLGGRRERPRSLRAQRGLRSRGSGGFGGLFGSRLFSGLFGRSGFFGSRLLGGSFFRYSFFGSRLFSGGFFRSSSFFGRGGFLGSSGFLGYGLFGHGLFSSRFLGRDGLLGSSFFCGCFFCSCHGFLLDQVEKSTQGNALHVLEGAKRFMALKQAPAP